MLQPRCRPASPILGLRLKANESLEYSAHGSSGDRRRELKRAAPSAKTRVVFLYAYGHNSRDAVANAISQLVRGLNSKGYEATVYARASSTGARTSRITRGLEQLRYLLSCIALALFRHRSHDVIVTVDVPTGLGLVGLLANWASRRRVRHVSWVLDLYQFQPGLAKPGLPAIRRMVDRFSLRRSDELVTIGSCMSKLVHTNTGRDAAVIPMWQDEGWLHPVESGWRTRQSIASESLLLLYSGHAGAQHPLRELVSAVTFANETVPVTLVVAGHGEHFELEKARVERESISNVRFVAPVPFADVPSMLSAADVHVVSLASAFTGTCVPSKTYAAMAVGRPCLFLGSKTVQAAIDIANADAGVVVSENDGHAIAEELIRMATDDTRRNAQGVRGRDFFLRERSLSSQSSEWDRFLSGLRA